MDFRLRRKLTTGKPRHERSLAIAEARLQSDPAATGRYPPWRTRRLRDELGIEPRVGRIEGIGLASMVRPGR